MQIKLINCMAKLQTQGIDLDTGKGVDTLCMRLQEILPCEGWNYGFSEDNLTINVIDGTTIPDMSGFGDVVT